MIPTDKALQRSWLRGVKLADRMLEEAYEQDRFMLMAARAEETHDNIVRRYLTRAEAEGEMVLEGFTATLSDVIASGTGLDAYQGEAKEALYWAQHPERAKAEYERGEA